ncbi:hypothetical protein PG996_003064 [Apiospora saccharicola]|uniref:Uncharacterized protein n=1 Tax=Apiospora saccharicola TaxID=335842 RepID=A0ABR1W3Z8_9PEZI
MTTSKRIDFSPDADIPSLEGKVILITGANSGLGKQASLDLAKHSPAMIYMAARDPAKGNEAVADVNSQVPEAHVSYLEMDLSSFASIKKAAKTVLESSPRLDILMLNAGLMGCPPKATVEGYEIQMGTNLLGHALLLKLLTPLLHHTSAITGAPARVVSMASSAWKHAGPEKIQFDTLKDPFGGAVTPVRRYIQSKTANMLYASEVAKHCHSNTTDDTNQGEKKPFVILSVDPGEVNTQLFTREPGDEQMAGLQAHVAPKVVRPVVEGVKNQLWAATAPDEDVVNGAHYEPVGYSPEPSGVMLDEELGARVWEWTRNELEGQEI